MDFDLEEMVKLVRAVDPYVVSIGADSGGHDLVEPNGEKVVALIEELKKTTMVEIKSNLKRITGDVDYGWSFG